MNSEALIREWYSKWESGDFLKLPLKPDFTHSSPFGKIEGRDAYLKIVEENKDKFLGYKFQIHEIISGKDKASVRYTAKQGNELKLDVSEWFYFENGLIREIKAYYHIGEIAKDRQIKDYK